MNQKPNLLERNTCVDVLGVKIIWQLLTENADLAGNPGVQNYKKTMLHPRVGAKMLA